MSTQILYQSSPQQIVNKIFQSNDIQTLLKDNDAKLLKFNRQQLCKKWSKSMLPPNINCEINNDLSFGSPLSNTQDKIQQEQHPTNNQQINGNALQQQDKSEKKEEGVKQQVGVTKQNEQILQTNTKQDAPQIIQTQVKQNSQSQPLVPHQSFSPFLPNRQNPFDRNANAKALKQKYDKTKIDRMKMNIVALVQSSRSITQQNQQIKYGKSLPKPSTDICDLLNSTLTAKRKKQSGLKTQPITNPFIRIPPKFYDSVVNLYSPSNWEHK